jgi:hypothetical protein
MTIVKRVSHFALATQRILTKICVGGDIQGILTRRHDWLWTPTTKQDVNDSNLQLQSDGGVSLGLAEAKEPPSRVVCCHSIYC